ncbi:copper transporter [Corynebacterium sanguinis]|uniref:copper transporter n=1 Tax=Corynebacterium TaxID=1716 RepID=UPI00223B1EC4|nr:MULTISPECIES: copper transporter [Corynebacterium]MCT1585641.1 copper transporter [Corynebacterium sanguinis]MCT2022994.1 copper transporter [Corynebacterium sanguinis]MCT2046627.1 copper transporter [Corynebacterium sanguinis]WNI12193.1 copper transporter [Corynebacterium sp. Z-1]
MRQNTGAPGFVAAGLGWGLAAGLALGVLLIAPAMGALQGASTSEAQSRDPQEQSAEAEAAAANEVLAAKAEEMVEGELEGNAIVMIRAAGVDDDSADKQRWLLNTAGADNAGTITLTEKFTSQDAANELSTIISSTLPAGAQLSVDNRSPGVHAGEALAAGLGEASATDRDFLLETLAQAGFLTYDDSVTAADAAVLLTGPTAQDSPYADRLLADMAQAFNAAGGTLVVTGEGTAASEGAPRVDYADTEAGRVNTVFTLRDELP